MRPGMSVFYYSDREAVAKKMAEFYIASLRAKGESMLESMMFRLSGAFGGEEEKKESDD